MTQVYRNFNGYADAVVVFNFWSRGRQKMGLGVFKEIQEVFSRVNLHPSYQAAMELTTLECYDCNFSGTHREFQDFLTNFYLLFDPENSYDPDTRRTCMLTANIENKARVIMGPAESETKFFTAVLKFKVRKSYSDKCLNILRSAVTDYKTAKRVRYKTIMQPHPPDIMHSYIFSKGTHMLKFESLMDFIFENTVTTKLDVAAEKVT